MTVPANIDPETGEVLEVMDATEARELTDGLRKGLDLAWEVVAKLYAGRAWLALGHPTWDEYCEAEFDGCRVKLPREERAQKIGSLRSAGLSLRAIGAATGVSEATVRRELKSGATNDAPEPRSTDVTPRMKGMDGKSYPAAKNTKKGSAADGSSRGGDAGTGDGADSHDVGRAEPEADPKPASPARERAATRPPRAPRRTGPDPTAVYERGARFAEALLTAADEYDRQAFEMWLASNQHRSSELTAAIAALTAEAGPFADVIVLAREAA